MKKIFVRVFALGASLILTIYIGLFFYYHFSWKNHYSEQQVDNLIVKIRSSSTLTDTFYTLYDKIYKDRREKITSRYLKQFWTDFLLLEYPLQNNWQLQAAHLADYKGHRGHTAPWTLAFRINRDASPEKCFDYIMTDRYSKYCQKFKITDTLPTLDNTEQIIKFLVAHERPWYYRIHPTRFKLETDSLRKILGHN